MGAQIIPGRGQCHQVPLPEALYKFDGFRAAVLERHTSVRSLTVPSSSSWTTSAVRRLPALLKRPWPLQWSRGDGNGRPSVLSAAAQCGSLLAVGLTALDRKRVLSASVVILRSLHTSPNTGVGSNPVWRASGHNRACRRSGASLDTTRLESVLKGRQTTQCQRAQARHDHRNVCGRIGRDQTTEMGEWGVSERTPMVDGFRYPLATRHPHVTTPGNRQPVGSRRGGLRETSILWLPFLTGIQFTAARGSYASHTQAYVERTRNVRRAYVGVRSTQHQLERFLGRSFHCGFLGNFGRLFGSFLVSSDSRIVRESPPVPRLPHPGWKACHLVADSTTTSQARLELLGSAAPPRRPFLLDYVGYASSSSISAGALGRIPWAHRVSSGML